MFAHFSMYISDISFDSLVVLKFEKFGDLFFKSII